MTWSVGVMRRARCWYADAADQHTAIKYSIFLSSLKVSPKQRVWRCPDWVCSKRWRHLGSWWRCKWRGAKDLYPLNLMKRGPKEMMVKERALWTHFGAYHVEKWVEVVWEQPEIAYQKKESVSESEQGTTYNILSYKRTIFSFYGWKLKLYMLTVSFFFPLMA